jgi:hypothetical protein
MISTNCPFCGVFISSDEYTVVSHDINDCHLSGIAYSIEDWARRPEIDNKPKGISEGDITLAHATTVINWYASIRKKTQDLWKDFEDQ